MEVVLDFETVSQVDLKKAGAEVYWHHPTEILCLVYTVFAATYSEKRVWTPGVPDAYLDALVNNPEVTFISHGPFEQIGWAAQMTPLYGFAPLPVERWHDTMAVCAWRAQPLQLERAAAVNGLEVQKDMQGRRLTLSLSKQFVRTGTFDRRPETIERVVSYCATDVDAEAELHRRLGYLSAYERRVWELDQRINQRGILLDRPFVLKCVEVVERALAPMHAEFEALTGCEVTQTARIMEWCHKQGAPIANLQKEYLDKVLGGSIDDLEFPSADDAGDALVSDQGIPVSLPDHVRRALQIRQVAGSASVKKLPRMLACIGPGGRVRYATQYHAAGTGRWGGRLFQPQNFPRGSLRYGEPPAAGAKDERKAPPIELTIAAIMTGDPAFVSAALGQPPIECVVSALRHAIIAEPEKLLGSGDYSGIEMRMDLALAGQHDKCRLLASGADVYCDMAERIYHRPISKDDVKERTIGKNTVLGDGFGMGGDTFCQRYIPECQCKLTPGRCKQNPLPACRVFAGESVSAYRKEWAPEVPKLWNGLASASLNAVLSGRPEYAYGIVYEPCGGDLKALLPSGQVLWYNQVEMTTRAVPWDATDRRLAWKYKAWKKGQWRTVYAWGGLLTENVVQALARGLLVDAMFRLEKEGFPLVLTVHDEAVTEVERGRADFKAYKQIMEELPQWAKDIGLPVNVEGWVGERYRK